MKVISIIAAGFLFLAGLYMVIFSSLNDEADSRVIVRTVTVQVDPQPEEDPGTAASNGTTESRSPEAREQEAVADPVAISSSSPGLSGGSCDSMYSDGYNAAYDERYNYRYGYQSGYEEGYEAGLMDGADFNPPI